MTENDGSEDGVLRGVSGDAELLFLAYSFSCLLTPCVRSLGPLCPCVVSTLLLP
jgi:hypothetical protein